MNFANQFSIKIFFEPPYVLSEKIGKSLVGLMLANVNPLSVEGISGTSYIPPVKPILLVHDYEVLRISPIFGNTPPAYF
jgi:hypothetical protein